MKLRIITGRWEKKQQYHLCLGLGILLVVGLTGLTCYKLMLDRVVLTVDGQRYEWKTLRSNVAKVLQEKQVVLGEGDEVKPPLLAPIKENTEIEVVRGFKVEITVAGKTTEFKTITRSVKEVLVKAGVKFDSDDIIKPGLETMVEPDAKIRVIHVRTEIVTKQVAINPETEYQSDKTMERGKRKTTRSGKPGLAEYQIQMIYQDGVLTKKTTLAKKVINPAVNEIVVVGTKTVIRTLVTSRGTYRYRDAKVMEATAYSPGPESCGKWANGYTYTGKKAGYGVVAVDPRVIRLGTQLYIEGYGKAEAADIGGAIKGNKIDLCYETHQEALRFGRKKIKVYILE